MDKNFIIPAIIIFELNFKKIPLWNLEMNNRDENSLTTYENKLKEIVGYTWGNNHRFIQTISGGHLFMFHVHYSPTINNQHVNRTHRWEISVWDETGNSSVITIGFEVNNKETDVVPDEVFQKIIHACNNHSNGIHICSGCGKEVTHIAGHYFAGNYCQHCWDTKYKAIEARENYN